MSYDVLVFAMTDSQMMNLRMGPESLGMQRDRLKSRIKPWGFAEDLVVETHSFPNEKKTVWLQRMTHGVMAKRVQQIAIKCDEDAVESCRTLHCPHNEPVFDDDVMHYLGFKLMFCHDCAMIFAGEVIEIECGFMSALDHKATHRHFRMRHQRQRWLNTRKINWVYCGGPRVCLEPYKKQMGF